MFISPTPNKARGGGKADGNSKLTYYQFSYRLVRFPIDVGSFETLVTNLSRDEFPLAELKRLYHMRWEIENCFDYMKNNVVRKALHAQDNETIDAQCFISHVALLYFYRLLKAIDKAGLKEDYSPEEIIKKRTTSIKICEYPSLKQLTEMTIEDSEIFKRLGINL